MARTAEGAQLTDEHRAAQSSLRAHALADFALLVPLWTGDDNSLGNLAQATVPLIGAYRQISGSLGASYYAAFRTAEEVNGRPAIKLAGPAAADKITTSIRVTSRVVNRAGLSPEQARGRAISQMSGAVTRHILGGGRDTIIGSTLADEEALGWARVTDASPCAFCALLAGRGPIYKTEQTAHFSAHDHCTCAVAPMYDGADWPGRAREFHDLYQQAIRDAGSADELERGTSNDLLNAFRRAYEPAR